jgi:pimeloyl-ACP methyl ester carboxylesterase
LIAAASLFAAASPVRAQDLVMTAVSGPSTVTPGGKASVTVTVKNNSSVATQDRTYIYVSVRLSTDATITLSDPEMGNFTVIEGLAAGQAQTKTLAVTVPAATAPGSYRWGAWADKSNYIPETNNNNNGLAGGAVTVSAPPPMPNLQTGVFSPPNKFNSPGTASIGFRVANTGKAATTTSFRSDFYLSSNSTINSSDTKLNCSQTTPAGLAPDATTPLANVSCDIPAGFQDGTWYFGVIVDAGGTVAEESPSGENDNTSAAASTATALKPDLAVSLTGPASISAGGSASVTVTVSNTSAGTTATSRAAKVGLYLSLNNQSYESDDERLNDPTDCQVSWPLAVSGSLSKTCTASIPSPLPDGTYYLIAVVDPGHEIQEVSESNNTGARIPAYGFISPSKGTIALTINPFNRARPLPAAIQYELLNGAGTPIRTGSSSSGASAGQSVVVPISDVPIGSGYTIRIKGPAPVSETWGPTSSFAVTGGQQTTVQWNRSTPWIGGINLRKPDGILIPLGAADPSILSDGARISLDVTIVNPAPESQKVTLVVGGKVVGPASDPGVRDVVREVQYENLAGFTTTADSRDYDVPGTSALFASNLKTVTVDFGRAYPDATNTLLPDNEKLDWPSRGMNGTLDIGFSLRLTGTSNALADSSSRWPSSDSRVRLTQMCSTGTYTLTKETAATGSTVAVFVHGYLFFDGQDCASTTFRSYWNFGNTDGTKGQLIGALVDRLSASSIETWSFTWPSGQSIAAAGDALRDSIRSRFPGKHILLIGHSMGGVVAQRAAFGGSRIYQQPGDPIVDKIINLGSPQAAVTNTYAELGAQFSAYEASSAAFFSSLIKRSQALDDRQKVFAAGGEWDAVIDHVTATRDIDDVHIIRPTTVTVARYFPRYNHAGMALQRASEVATELECTSHLYANLKHICAGYAADRGDALYQAVLGVLGLSKGGGIAIKSQPEKATIGVAVPQIVLQLRTSFGTDLSVSGIGVSVISSDGTGLEGVSSAQTDATGAAKIGPLTFRSPGSVKLTAATSDGLSVELAPFTVSLPVLAIERNPAGAVAGSPLTSQPVISVVDAFGNVMTGFSGTVTASKASGSASLASAGLTASFVNGRATFSDLQIDGSGSLALAFAAPGTTGIQSAAIAVTAEPSVATSLAVKRHPGGAASGSPFSQQPTIEVRDQKNVLMTSYNGSVSVSLASGSGSLTGTLTVDVVNGVGKFTDLQIAGNGAHQLRFQLSPAELATTSDIFTVSAVERVATSLSVTTQPGGALSGQPFVTQPQVTVLDQFGAVLTTYAQTVTAALVEGPGTLDSPSGSAVISFNDGVAAFTGLRISGGGSHRISFTSGSLPIVNTEVFGVAQSATSLILRTQPAGAANATPFTQQPVVVIADQAGLPVTGATSAITAVLASGSGLLGGTVSVNAVDGIATFGDLAITGDGQYTLRFEGASLAAVTSVTIAIGSAIPVSTRMVTAPSGAVSGLVLGVQPVVEVLDAAGARVNSFTGDISASVVSGTGKLSGTTVSAVGGVATFGSLRIDGSGAHVLTFSGRNIAASTSPEFNVTQTPASIAIATQPSGATSGSPFSTQPVIRVLDNAGLVVDGNATQVSAAIANGTGTLAGASTVTATNGTVAFTDLQVTGSGSHRIAFSGAGFSVTSASFDVVSITTGDRPRVLIGTSATSDVKIRGSLVLPVVADLTEATSLEVASVSGRVAFDPRRVQFDSARASFGALTANGDSAGVGKVFISQFDPQGTTEPTTTLFTLYFSGRAEGPSKVDFLPTVVADSRGRNFVGFTTVRANDVCTGGGLWGDVNGDGAVNIIDAQQIARHTVHLSILDSIALTGNGDITDDGVVDIIDAQQLARFSVGLDAAQRANTDRPNKCVGEGAPFKVSITGSGNGSGQVSAPAIGSSPSLDCVIRNGVPSGTCEASYPSASSITLTATPAAGSAFGNWGESCASAPDATCTIAGVLDAATASVSFVSSDTYSLTITGSGNGDGTVTAPAVGAQPALSCAIAAGVVTGVCAGIYPSATALALTASPAAGSGFEAWSGVCTPGTPATCTVQDLVGAKTASASFTATSTYTVTITGSGTGDGVVTAPSVAGQPALACTITGATQAGICSGTYPTAAAIALTATAGAGSRMAAWGGVCSTATGSSCAISGRTGGTSASVNFAAVTTYTLTIGGSGTGSGVVTAPAAGGQPALNCSVTATTATGTCSASYESQTSVTLTAVPNAGSQLTAWGGACVASTTSTCTLAGLTGAHSASAIFGTIALATTLSDDFSSGLGNWFSRSGSWTASAGTLVGEYDIACGSTGCPQGVLELRSDLQPAAGKDWRAEIQFSKVAYPYSSSYNLTYAQLAFSLYVSSSERQYLWLGQATNNEVMPATYSTLGIDHRNGLPWSYIGGGTVPVAPWAPTAWNTAALEKRGNQYTVFFNGVQVYSFIGGFSQAPKIGFQVYGKLVADNFKLTVF